MSLYLYLLIVGGTALWFAPLLAVFTREKQKAAYADRRARWGVVLQGVAYSLVWQGSFWQRSVELWRVLLSVLLFVLACLTSWTAVRALGRHLRVDAALGSDHELVRSGPYRLVRHPIYASMLCLLLATGLLVSPVAVRKGGGWPGIFLLGTAYGVVEEGVALQSLFNPDLYHASEWGGRFLGINGVYAEASLTIHAVWTAAIPILVCDLLFPQRRGAPYIGRVGFVMTGIWYAMGVGLLGLLTRFTIAPGYWAPDLLLGLSFLAAFVLAGMAFAALPQTIQRTARSGAAPPPLAAFSIIFAGSMVWHFLLAILWRLEPEFARWPLVLAPMAAAMAALLVLLFLLRRWALTQNWGDRHRLAIAAGAIASHGLVGCAILARGAIDRVAISVIGTAAIWSFWANVCRRTGDPVAARK